MARSVDELIRLAMIYGEQDRRTMSEAAHGLPAGKEAAELADEFRAYRMRRWGRTQFEADIADATSISVDELRKRPAQETSCEHPSGVRGAYCNKCGEQF